MEDYRELQEKIKYRFNNIKYLDLALTHSSYINEHKENKFSNERLEFLGDGVLGVIVNKKIYNLFPEKDEGFLSKLKASVVCEETLAKFARALNYDKYLKMGQSEISANGMNRDSVLCDCFEAVLGAIFLDSDYTTVENWLNGIITDDIYFDEHLRAFDSKTKIQEIMQKSGKVLTYQIISEKGPDHNKTFVASALIDGKEASRGIGNSKKSAEQDAAKKLLDTLGKR